jgi:16S rRNA C1402 (ribose-2'-O) methylase RsmI
MSYLCNMLILLDIDGVMVPASLWKKPEFLNDGFPTFSSKATHALQKIISETSANILLTTSHKSNYDIEEWENIFKNRGIQINKINRLSENTNRFTRKEEIVNWFNSNSAIYEEFIIIDDDKSLNDLPKFLKDRLIQTSPLIGLTDELVDEALKVINKEKHLIA